MGQHERLLLCVKDNENKTARDMESMDVQRMPHNIMIDIGPLGIFQNEIWACSNMDDIPNINLDLHAFTDINQNSPSSTAVPDFRNADCSCESFHCRTCIYRSFKSPSPLSTLSPLVRASPVPVSTAPRACDKINCSLHCDTLKRPRACSDGGDSATCDKASMRDLRRMHTVATGSSGSSNAMGHQRSITNASATQQLYDGIQQTVTSSEERGPDHFAVNFLHRPSKKVLSKEHPGLIEPSSRIPGYTRLAGTLCNGEVVSLDIVYAQLHSAGWYHGPLTMSEARDKLRPYPVGTFLLRDSSDSNYIFSLSFKTRRGTTSIRIIYQEGRFRFDTEDGVDTQKISTSPCIFRLLENYVQQSDRHCGISKGKRVLLESTGRMDTPLVLAEGCRRKPSSLKHLARLSLNRTLPEETRLRVLQFMPPDIEEFMLQYKFVI